MAESTQKLVGLAHTQNVITGIEAILLVMTLGATAWAAYAASRAAKSADEAVVLTRKNAQQELRAYLSISPQSVSYSEGRGLTVHVAQRNCGQTPASSVRFFGVLRVLDYPLANDFEFPEPDFGPSVNVIHPNINFSVPVWAEPRIWYDDFLEMLPIIDASRNRRPFFIGALSYRDIFGKEHMTKACWSYHANELRTKLGAVERESEIQVSFEYTADYNEAD